MPFRLFIFLIALLIIATVGIVIGQFRNEGGIRIESCIPNKGCIAALEAPKFMGVAQAKLIPGRRPMLEISYLYIDESRRDAWVVTKWHSTRTDDGRIHPIDEVYLIRFRRRGRIIREIPVALVKFW